MHTADACTGSELAGQGLASMKAEICAPVTMRRPITMVTLVYISFTAWSDERCDSAASRMDGARPLEPGATAACAAGRDRRPARGRRRDHRLPGRRARRRRGRQADGDGGRAEHRGRPEHPRSARHARPERTPPAVRRTRTPRHPRRLHHDHEPGGDPLHPSEPGPDRRALRRQHRARPRRTDVHRDLHRHARPVRPGRRARVRREPPRHRARLGRHHGPGDLGGAPAAAAAARRGRRRRPRRRSRMQLPGVGAAAPADPRRRARRAARDVRVLPGDPALRPRGPAPAGPDGTHRPLQRRRPRPARPDRRAAGTPGRQARAARRAGRHVRVR